MDIIWWLSAAIGGIVLNLIASELFAWGPRLSEWLMQRAVRRLAPAIRERMHEEWSGHLQSIPAGFWRIIAAVGFMLATSQINIALQMKNNEGMRQKNLLPLPQQKACGLKIISDIDIADYDIDIILDILETSP